MKKLSRGCDNHKTRLNMYNYHHHQVKSQKYKNQNSSCHFQLIIIKKAIKIIYFYVKKERERES